MTAKNFEKTLKAYHQRKPFRAFRVRFISGEHIDVHHPEALVTRSGVAVYFDTDGTPTIFDHEGVSEVIGKTERRSA
jgi:hypothetical protein